MATLQIRKKSTKVWEHVDTQPYIITKFYAKVNGDEFKIVEGSGSNRREYDYTNITVYDDTDLGTPEAFGSALDLMLRLEELSYVGFNRDGDIPPQTFEALSDTFQFAGNELKAVRVNAAGDKLEPYVPTTGSDVRRHRYEFVLNNNFAASTSWYTMRRDIAGIYNPLWIDSIYDGTSNVVTDVRVLSHLITYDQKTTKAYVVLEYLPNPMTIRIQYYEINEVSNTGLNNYTIHEIVIPANPSANKKRIEVSPSAFTMSANGYMTIAVFNNNLANNMKTAMLIVETESV